MKQHKTVTQLTSPSPCNYNSTIKQRDQDHHKFERNCWEERKLNLKKLMDTWRERKYTVRQKKKEMKVNTASAGQDQLYFKINIKKKLLWLSLSESFKEIFITLLYASKSVCTHVPWIEVCTEVRRQVVGVILYFHYVRPEKPTQVIRLWRMSFPGSAISPAQTLWVYIIWKNQ